MAEHTLNRAVFFVIGNKGWGSQRRAFVKLSGFENDRALDKEGVGAEGGRVALQCCMSI